jgi:putative transposase
MAVPPQCPDGARGRGVSLMSDHGCQPTAMAVMKACSTLGIHQAFPSDNNPQGHAETERFMRTLKEACLWRTEWTCPFALVSTFAGWIERDNEQYLHAALGYKTPHQFERAYQTSHGSPFVAA